MRLFAHELAEADLIRSEVDLDHELPTICKLANKFLRPLPFEDEDADLCDRELVALLTNTSTSLKVEVAERLAHVERGPERSVRLLAHDGTPNVAVPVLRYSPLLTPEDLAAIARLRAQRLSEEHLLAIAARRELDTCITDILSARGTERVLEALAENDTARFTLLGFCRLAMRSYTGSRDPPPRRRREWLA